MKPIPDLSTAASGGGATPSRPRIFLAPMEGMLDCVLRDILTRVGGVDACVSEFIRVTDSVLPKRAYVRVMPELLNGGRTLSGVPVYGQLLGSDVSCLADNAAQLASLGPAGVDLNFGCPAKVVNRHGGGAMLLTDPDLLYRIVSAVRRAVPATMSVSAKMRLGYMDDLRAEECAIAIAEAGVSHLVVHARTKAHGYRPPAYWERIADIREHVSVPVIANGEIWTVQDALRCREVSGCQDLMLGRGMVSDPGLASDLLRATATVSGTTSGATLAATSATTLGTNSGATSPGPPGGESGPQTEAGLPPVTWQTIAPLLPEFWAQVTRRVVPRHRAGRLKQWLNLMRRRHPEAEQLFTALRTINDVPSVEAQLARLAA